MSTPICPYCDQPAKLVDSEEVYGRSYGKMWLCRCLPTLAYVGCRKGTDYPLGTLANESTRAMRKKAHRAFDPLWKKGDMTRKQAYAWLAKALQIEPDACHIGEADEAKCERIIDAVVEERWQRLEREGN